MVVKGDNLQNFTLFQCLLLALGYRDITEMSLNGHDMESIAELAINKFSNVSRCRVAKICK